MARPGGSSPGWRSTRAPMSSPSPAAPPPPRPRLAALGVPFAKTPITVFSDGVANIIAGMHAAGIKRFACVSSSAIGPHPEPLGGFIFEKILQPYVVNKLGKTVYDDLRRMEA